MRGREGVAAARGSQNPQTPEMKRWIREEFANFKNDFKNDFKNEV
jgi:hypothetical protein